MRIPPLIKQYIYSPLGQKPKAMNSNSYYKANMSTTMSWHVFTRHRMSNHIAACMQPADTSVSVAGNYLEHEYVTDIYRACGLS